MPFTVSYFFTKKDVIGLIVVTNKIPKIIDNTPGMIIIDRFDIPETFMAVISSVFLIFKKNQIPDTKITNGKKLFNKLGTNNKDNKIGVTKVTSKSLKKLISSNIFIIKPKRKKTPLVITTILINSKPRYLFNRIDLIIIINVNFHI